MVGEKGILSADPVQRRLVFQSGQGSENLTVGGPIQTVRAVLQSWGPGRFDGHLILDGQAFGPGGSNASVLIPSLHGKQN